MYIHVNQKIKIMKKQFIVIEEGTSDYYIVNDLKKLITEMYEEYYEKNDSTEDSFYRVHKVIEIKGEFEITEMN
jgi:hypothetical protein